jgi:hypothetical protein
MTNLLKEAIDLLRELPEHYQNQAARHLIQYVQEFGSDEPV